MSRRDLARWLTVAAICGAAAPASPVSPEGLRAGERIYREGILPSGEPVRAALGGGAPAPGLTFTCAGCHLRSGLGSFDEGVTTPAATGAKLFQPLPRLFKGIEQVGEPQRPAYTDASLVTVLRTGVDPAGRVLKGGMPRFMLDEEDARLLVDYLKALSAAPSPGVDDTTLRFATVISEDVSPELRDAMLAAFAADFEAKNNQIAAFSSRRYAHARLMAEKMFDSREFASKRMVLTPWILKGPPESWRAQLDEYDRKEPVFALLGGLVSGDWGPIHRFAEEREIPTLFPNTDLPVVSGSGWYTLYLSKGYFQEGETAAQHLAARLSARGRVVQLVRVSARGEALSAGFEQAWRELGRPAPVTVRLPSGRPLEDGTLRGLLGREKPAALVVWDDAAALPALKSLKGRKDRPQLVYLSARYLGENSWTLDESIRDFTRLTYPFSFSPYVPRAAMGRPAKVEVRKRLKRADVPLRDEAQRIGSLTSALTQVLTLLLMDLKGNYYRDYLLDVAGMMADQPYPVHGRISVAGGQRFASRTCLVVRLSRGDDPELVEEGDP